jgi:hypothetical protein
VLACAEQLAGYAGKLEPELALELGPHVQNFLIGNNSATTLSAVWGRPTPILLCAGCQLASATIPDGDMVPGVTAPALRRLCWAPLNYCNQCAFQDEGSRHGEKRSWDNHYLKPDQGEESNSK